MRIPIFFCKKYKLISLYLRKIFNMNENDIMSVITDKPDRIKVNGKSCFFYPLTLGKSLIVAEYCNELGINERFFQENMILSLLHLVSKEREKCLHFIHLFTIKNTEDAKYKIYDDVSFEVFSKMWRKVCIEELAAVMMSLLSRQDLTDEMSKHFNLDKEMQRMHRAEEAKNDSSTFLFCGKSIYGTLIHSACKEFGWTYDYTVWGISLTNLRMLFADSVKTMYLSKDERKKAHISNDRTTVNMDNAQAAREFIRKHNFN